MLFLLSQSSSWLWHDYYYEYYLVSPCPLLSVDPPRTPADSARMWGPLSSWAGPTLMALLFLGCRDFRSGKPLLPAPLSSVPWSHWEIHRRLQPSRRAYVSGRHVVRTVMRNDKWNLRASPTTRPVDTTLWKLWEVGNCSSSFNQGHF